MHRLGFKRLEITTGKAQRACRGHHSLLLYAVHHELHRCDHAPTLVLELLLPNHLSFALKPLKAGQRQNRNCLFKSSSSRDLGP